MPAGKQTVALQLGQGLAQDVGEFLAPPGKLESLKNCTIDKQGTISVRPGFLKLSDSKWDTGLFHPRLRLQQVGNQLLGTGTTRIGKYSEYSGAWIDFDDIPEANVIERIPASRGVNEFHYDCDVVYCNGVYVYCWHDNNVTMFLQVMDAETGAKYPMVYYAAAPQPRLVVLGTKVYVVNLNTANTDLVARVLDTLSLASGWSGTTTLSNTADAANPAFEACASSTHIFAVYNDTSRFGKVLRIDSTLTVTHTANTAQQCENSWAISASNLYGHVWIAYDAFTGASGGVRIQSFTTAALVAVLADTQIYANIYDSGSDSAVLRIGCVVDPVYDYLHVVFETYEDTTATPALYQCVIAATVNASGTPTHWSMTYHLGLSSLPIVYNNRLYAVLYLQPCIWSTAAHLQPNSYLCDLRPDNYTPHTPARAVVRLAQQRCGRLDFKKPSNLFATVDAHTYVSAIPRLSETQLGNTGWLQAEGFDLFVLRFADVKSLHLPQRVGPYVALSGGVPSLYDGNRVFEIGYHYYPRGHLITHTAGGGSRLTLLGTYSWRAVYRWVDAQGGEHISAPSEAVTYTLTAADDTVTIDFTNLTLTDMEDTEDSRHEVKIDLYRTTNGGDTYYYVSTLTNDRHSAYATFTDATPDTTISSNRELYTGGQVLDNEQAPAFRHMCVHNNRLFGIVADYPDQIWYSKQILPYSGIAFSKAFFVSNPQAESYTALASANSVLMAFRYNGIDLVCGQGPGDNGQGATFEEPVATALDVGCIDARSLVWYPGGYFFQAQGGIYSITPGGQTNFVGSPVRGELDTYSTIVGTALDASSRRVLFLAQSLASGTIVLAYHYQWDQWCTWEIPSSTGTLKANLASAIVAKKDGATDTIHLLGTDGHVLQARSTAQDPDNTYVSQQIKTGWISGAGVQGYNNAWRFQLLGKYISPHSIVIKLYHNYSTTLVSTHTWTEANVLSCVSGYREQIEVAAKQTVGESIQICIEFQAGAVPGTAQAMRVESLALEYGPEPGLMRLPESFRK